MPGKGPAGKRHRQNIAHRLRNREYKSSVKTAKGRFLDAIKAEDKELASEKFKAFAKEVDTAQGRGIYHKNTAARKKSRMHKLLNAMK
ncbi:MAG: 30S ribosomal protein S20 [Spirochaetales bacterium]|nr:30S ribosomal protein S20 [Spirochaetales bacterium]